MTRFLLLIFTFSIVGLKAQTDEMFEFTINSMIKNTVPVVKTEELVHWNNAHFLDCRAKEEFKTSHLKNAVRVGHLDYSTKRLPAMDLNDTIVVYCSMGVRSEEVGEKLQILGYKNVFNYYGGIFDWVNKGFTIYQEEEQTKKIHGFSKAWSIWLKAGEVVY